MSDITYYELSNYNSGKLIAKTFTLDYTTHEEHMEELQDWLKALTEETGELCEEWIVADYEGVPMDYVSEWSISPDFWDYLEAVEDHGEEIVDAALACDIPLDKISDAYRGHWDSREDMAFDLLEETGQLGEMPENLQSYFDFDAYGRDLLISDMAEDDGHYFWTNW